MLKSISSVFGVVVGVMLSVFAFAQDLNREQVMDVVNRVDAAAEVRDAAAVGDALATDVKITINVDYMGQPQVMHATKNEYVAMLREGWAMYSEYKFEKSNLNIELEGSKAYVTADVYETMVLQGHRLTGTTKENAVIELVDGKALITQIVGHSKIQ